jgi:DnaK suppressor protein
MEEQLDLQKIQQELTDQRSRLSRRIDDMRHMDQGSGVMNPDRDDLAYQYVSAEMQAAELARLEERLIQVEQALERIKEGNYGTCKRCGETINPARLAAIPYALLCIKCQERNS